MPRVGRIVQWVIGVAVSGASAAHGQNLDAGKSPAQIFADTCNACHRSAREIKRTSPVFLREHYTTGLREATAMAAYLASVGSDPRAVLQRRPPVMGAGRAPSADTATARPPAAAPQAPEQPKSDAQAALPGASPAAHIAANSAMPAEQAHPAATGARSRRPSESMEFDMPSSWADGLAAVAPQTAAMPAASRYPGHEIEE